MLLRICGDTDAEVGGGRLLERLEVAPGVHVADLADEVERGRVRGACPGGFAWFPVSADREYVLDAQVVQLDQGVLGLLPREPVTQQVGTGSSPNRCLIAAHRPNVPGALRVTRRRHVPFGDCSHRASAAWLVMSMNGGRNGITDSTAS